MQFKLKEHDFMSPELIRDRIHQPLTHKAVSQSRHIAKPDSGIAYGKFKMPLKVFLFSHD
jgi:hypothetical protein